MTFVKGQSGNPGGKVRGTLSIVNVVLKHLKEKGPDGKTYSVAVAEQLVALALHAKDHRTRLGAIEVILNRVDGKVTERFEHSGPDGAPMRVENVLDLSRLTEGEFAHLESLVDKAAADSH